MIVYQASPLFSVSGSRQLSASAHSEPASSAQSHVAVPGWRRSPAGRREATKSVCSTESVQSVQSVLGNVIITDETSSAYNALLSPGTGSHLRK